jgi:ribose transport system substrate-binding protein
MKKASLFAATAVVALAAAGAARADDIMAAAKARVAAAIQRAGAWDGPTTGPTATPNKLIVYVAGDLRNGGTSGVADGVKEAVAAIGWKLQVIDGQGQVSTRTAALNQAIALKPDGIVVAGFDAIEQNAALANVKAAGIPFVGWHATIEPGPDPATGMFANVNTRILDVANTAADLAIVDSGGKAGVVIFGDSNYAMAIGKAKMMAAEIEKCGGCKVLSLEDSPMTEASLRMPQLTTSLLQRFGDKWTYSLAVKTSTMTSWGRRWRAPARAGPTRRTISLQATGRSRPSRAFAPSSSRWPRCRSRCTSRDGSLSTSSIAPSPSSPGPATSPASIW